MVCMASNPSWPMPTSSARSCNWRKRSAINSEQTTLYSIQPPPNAQPGLPRALAPVDLLHFSDHLRERNGGRAPLAALDFLPELFQPFRRPLSLDLVVEAPLLLRF